MATKVIIPKTGYATKEATIVEWLKMEGEEVKEGEPLVVIETEKVTIEIDSPTSGIVRRIISPVGITANVGEVIAIVGNKNEDINALEAEIAQEKVETMGPSLTSPRVRATPSARRVAIKQGIDLTKVQGTGPEGRITKEDVLRFIENSKQVQPPAKGEALVREEIIPLKGIRKIIAERMVSSKNIAAHVTTTTEVDLTNLVELRQQLLGLGKELGVNNLSYTALITKATAYALKEYPIVNSSLIEEAIVLKKELNIGIAVATEEGLIVPVVHNVDKKNLLELSIEIEKLAEKARSKTLSFEEVTEGTFTISNVGMFDVGVFTPIIRQPESAILGIGSITDKPAVFQGEIKIRKIANFCLSFDHRVFDGAIAAQFLHRIKQIVENPALLLLMK